MKKKLLDEIESKIGKIINLKIIGEGIDFIIYKAYCSKYKTIALRIPRSKEILYGKEVYLSSNLIKKEIEIYKFLITYDICVPKIYYFSENIYPFLVYEYIENDQSLFDNKALGILIKNVHSLSVPSHLYISDFKHKIADRLFERFNYLSKEMKIKNPFINKSSIYSLINITNKLSLLHMDIRPDNILVLNGNIKSIIDWTYALVGDPLFELYRISEFDFANNYKIIDDEFYEGYDVSTLKGTNELTRIIYKLDASIMVLILFYENKQFSDKLQKQKEHVINQCEYLNNLLSIKKQKAFSDRDR